MRNIKTCLDLDQPRLKLSNTRASDNPSGANRMSRVNERPEGSAPDGSALRRGWYLPDLPKTTHTKRPAPLSDHELGAGGV